MAVATIRLMREAIAFVLGLAVAEGFRLVRDLAVENRRAEKARESEERRWEREDRLRAEALSEGLDRERREVKREEALRVREAQSSRRLVADELDSTYNHMNMMTRHRRWPVPDVMVRADFLTSAEWERNKESLAQVMDDQAEFLDLASFYYSVRQVRSRALGRDQTESPLLEGEDEVRLERMKQHAQALRWVVLGNHRLLVDGDGVRAVPRDGVDAFDERVHDDPVSSGVSVTDGG